jgi:hypothetical protein
MNSDPKSRSGADVRPAADSPHALKKRMTYEQWRKTRGTGLEPAVLDGLIRRNSRLGVKSIRLCL